MFWGQVFILTCKYTDQCLSLVIDKKIHLAPQLCLAEDDNDEEEVAQDGDDWVDAAQLNEHLLWAAIGGYHHQKLHVVLTCLSQWNK